MQGCLLFEGPPRERALHRYQVSSNIHSHAFTSSPPSPWQYIDSAQKPHASHLCAALEFKQVRERGRSRVEGRALRRAGRKSRRKGCQKHMQKQSRARKELAGEGGDGLVRVSGVSESQGFISGVRKQAVITKPVSNRTHPGLLKSPCWRSQDAWTTKEAVQTTWCGIAFYLFTSHSPPRKSIR